MKINKRIVIVLHIIFIVVAISTPFWLDWKYIFIGWILLLLQFKILGGCILSHMQFGKNTEGFWNYYVKKVFPSMQTSTMNIISDYVVPILVIIFAYIIQSNKIF